MHDGGAFSPWRDAAVARYRDVRAAQARKLLPIKHILLEVGLGSLEGSLIEPAGIDQPALDDTAHVEKMLNYVYLGQHLQPDHTLEIGFNWGYSASLLMEISGERLDTIDLAEHPYARRCADVLRELYGARFNPEWGDSRELMRTRAAERRYDLIVIDGGHGYRNVEADILHSIDALTPGGCLVVDDTDLPSVRAGVLATVMDHPQFIQLTPENFGLFPCVRRSHPYFEQLVFLKRSAR